MHILVLGGTRDAINLAALLLASARYQATYSLAGRTRRPLPSGLPTRVGGFGGVEGLTAWLIDERVDAVVDATHPFAAQMSRHAVQACQATGVPLARLDREPWAPADGDQWHRVPDLPGAARALERLTRPGARIFLTSGASTLSHFERFTDRHFVVRCVDVPEPSPRFASWRLITDRGPFDLASEQALLREERIDLLISKNSGGAAAEPKLAAARAAGIAVVMVDRPVLPAPDQLLFSPNAVMQWLDGLIGGTAGVAH